MRMLVVGGHGMAGHVFCDYFCRHTSHEVFTTVRPGYGVGQGRVLGTLNPRQMEWDVREAAKIRRVLEIAQPDVVINAVGLLNQQADFHPADAVLVNSWFPHFLASQGNQQGFRVIHISTDCVFSGRRGLYTERDEADGVSMYARTKRVGEVTYGPHVTIRTSIIGPELKRHGIGLFHWFMQQSGEVLGYTNVLWNGVSTLELAKFTSWMVEHRDVSGLVHLTAPQVVSKCDLLCMMQTVFDKRDVRIRPDGAVCCNRTLVNTRTDITWKTPSYRDMLVELRTWMSNRERGYSYG